MINFQRFAEEEGNPPNVKFQRILSTAPGLRPQNPGEAPPMAGFGMKSSLAWNYNNPYLHCRIK
ncbi:MAG: hypothetical protein FIB07_06390 [Candidatus Methanoperedens sp.]|nr:hypothetical protein [Candidatus Methanoperedens sp.]